MSKDGHTVKNPLGTVRIEPDALSALVVTAAERAEGARVRRPRRGLDIAVADGRVRVGLELAAQYGLVLPELAQAVQENVASVLRDAAGLEVAAIDVAVEELDL